LSSRTASRRLGGALLALSLLATLGCAHHRYDAYGHPYPEPHDHTHATRGAILGGLAGAGVGRMIAGHRHDEAGYFLGGALGLLTGAAIGDAMDRDHARRAAGPPPYPYPSNPPADPYPDVPPPGHDPDGGYDDGYDDHGGWDEGAHAPPPEPRILDLPDEVLFADGSDRLERGAERRLLAVAAALRSHPGTVAVVRGHASQREQDPPDLSEARAHAVRSFLLDQGVAPSRVTALGMGARFPLASDRTPEGQQRNRRAEVEVRSDRGHELAGLW
jgi:outer membrane protein OmpA-like peptidoglycan-associated protein